MHNLYHQYFPIRKKNQLVLIYMDIIVSYLNHIIFTIITIVLRVQSTPQGKIAVTQKYGFGVETGNQQAFNHV